MIGRKQLGQLTLITLVFYLPFIGKGVSYDDLVFLDYAKRLTKNPVRCVVDDYLYLGVELKDLVVFESTHPPFIPYVHKTVMFVFGENLMMMHLAMYGFLWLATMALACLIKRYSGYSPYLALAITLGPLFLPNATSLMTDTALFGLWFGAMVCLERAMDGPRKLGSRWHLGAALCTSAAFFTAYQGLGLLVLLPAMALMRGRLREGIVVVTLALIPFVLWMFLVWVNYDIVPYFSPPRDEINIANEVEKGLVWENIWLKSRALVFYLGATFAFFMPWFMRGKQRWVLALGALGWGWAMMAYLFPERELSFVLYGAVMGGAGLLVLTILAQGLHMILFGEDHQRRIQFGLLICVGGFLVFQVLLASFAAPRYNLVTLGALFLMGLVLRADQPVKKTPWACLLPTLVLGLLVAWAEKNYADAQRLDDLPIPADGAVHFAGEKGMQYNGEKLGYTYFLPQRSEDVHYLLVPEEIDHVAVPRLLLDNGEHIKTFVVDSPLPVRVNQRSTGAGFYIHNRGMLPFVFSREPIDRIHLYKIFHPGHRHWREKDYASVPAGQILPEAPLTQDFLCGPDGLTAFRIMFATYNRTNASTLVISLHELRDGEAGPAVFEERVDATTLEDNTWRRFDFPPLRSKHKHYRLQIQSPDAKPNSAVTVWTNSNADGSYRRGDTEKVGALGFETLCAPGTGVAHGEPN